MSFEEINGVRYDLVSADYTNSCMGCAFYRAGNGCLEPSLGDKCTPEAGGSFIFINKEQNGGA